MRRLRGPRNAALSLILAGLVTLVLAVPAFAYIQEGGTKNCGNFIAYVHARFSIDGETYPPGDSFLIFWNYASGWHTVEDNGGYSGDWFARGYNQLDTANTWVACRNYG